MKSLIINTADISGGAARAAYRLHQGLQSIGIESHMLVQQKLSNDKTVLAPKSKLARSLAPKRALIDKLPLKRYPNRKHVSFSLQWLPNNMPSKIARLSPDVVNLHWVGGGFLKLESVARITQPVVWTLHDMWPLTGGCHYNQGCDRYLSGCGSCPLLGSNTTQDISRWVWHRKEKAWKEKEITVVAVSNWLKECASTSPLFQNRRIEVIPNGIDTTIYKPVDKLFARKSLGLPTDKHIALFGAMYATSDRRKGFHLLLPALQCLSQNDWKKKLELVIFGASNTGKAPDFGLKTHYLGQIKDDATLSLAYSAADVFVLPSVQDNLPNTVMEALACGLPSVAFKVGGLPDLITHCKTGYLAEPYSTQDLARGIAWIVEEEERSQKLSVASREKALYSFTQKDQANRYQKLFESLLG